MVLGEFSTMADDGYEKVCKIKSLLAECMVPPRESQFLNLDRYIEEESGISFIPDPPNWCNISFRGFQERVLTYRPQHWGADPNAVLWFSKYGWRCTEKFVIKCDICSSTIECSSLIQKPDLWGEIAHKAHDNLCYWSFCPCPDRFIQIITHPKILSKNICHNWQKIVIYGIELPKVQPVLLDKMGMGRDILEHLFKIMESSFSEEGMSALILVICGWLKSSEDKTLECAYCQRHLALRHFFSIADSNKINDSAPVQNNLCAGNETTKMEVSETTPCKTLSSETAGDNFLSNTGCGNEFIHTMQQRKRARRGHPAVHTSTARHRANALVCVTKQKFPSFCNILNLRYGVKFPQSKRHHKNKKYVGRKFSGSDENVKNRLITNEIESTSEKPAQELCYIDKVNGEQDASVSNGTSLGNSVNNRKLPADVNTENMEICHIDKQPKVTDDVSVVVADNAIVHKEGIDTVVSVKCSVEDTVHPETEHGGFDSDLPARSSSSQNAELGRKLTESNLPTSDDGHMRTNELDGKGVSSLKSMQSNLGSEVNEVIPSEEDSRGGNNFEKSENEIVKRSVVSDTEKNHPNVSKRGLISDDDQETEGTNKRMKIGSENIHLKKKDLNPVIEHRFWCIWRIKTVDRLLGSPKEGWRQILDLLKFGVSPQNSETEEEAGDLFEEVKKIHYMMSGW